MNWKVIQGNNIDVLKTYPDNHFDSIVTDPPYGIAFLGKDWDSKKATETTSKLVALQNLPSGMKHTSLADDLEFQYWMRDVFLECNRVLKPGGHLLAFSAARTYHHMAMAAQTAGFEIRDQLQWIYGSGFPKAQDIGKAIQKRQGVEKTKSHKKLNGYAIEQTAHGAQRVGDVTADDYEKTIKETVCTSPEAQQWEGWKTALKPAHEPIVMARKPFKGSAIDNVLEHGVGALNINASRIPAQDKANVDETSRYPSNVIMDEEAGAILNKQAPKTGNASSSKRTKTGMTGTGASLQWHKSEGESNGISDGLSGASKFFYCPKVSRKERHTGDAENNHPTVKPVELMKYLIKLVTPAGGTVLDPFNGSGSTGMACVEAGFNYVGCELDPNYVEIANKRISAWEKQHDTPANNLFEDN